MASLHTSASDSDCAPSLQDGQGRRVLVISYNWPPDTSIGGVRPVKLVAQLRAQGWEPIILTVHDRYYEQRDGNLVDSSLDVRVIRTRCLPNIPRLYVSIRSFAAKLFVRPVGPDSAQDKFKTKVQSKDSREMEKRDGLKRVLLSIMYTPDENIGWLPFGLLRALTVVWVYRPKCIISTGPPFTAHLVGLLTSLLSRVAWIADFRDPWAMSETRPLEYTSEISNRVNRWIERIVVCRARRVVCVTPFMTRWYRAQYPNLPYDHWETITNGFSVNEFNAVAGVPHSQKFTISYLGSIEYERSPELVFKAVRDLFQEGLLKRENVAIRLIGKCREVRGGSMLDLIAAYDLGDIVTLVSAVPRYDALKEMRQAHVLLLLAPNQKLQIPGKTYEYIGANRRILAITESDGATADVVRSVGGAVVDQDDIAQMKNVLANWYGEYSRSSNGQISSAELQSNTVKYEWNSLGERYAHVAASVSCRNF